MMYNLTMNLSISEKIKIMCGRKNISVSELARCLDKSPQNFSQQLKRGDFRVSDLEKIAAVLDCDLLLEFAEKTEKS